jgi:outer membrane protein assembly factor BamA
MQLRHLNALPLLALAGLAQAETSPYYLGASLGYYHASNLYRSSGTPTSDQLSNATLLAGLDANLGRQRLFGDATVQRSQYQDNSDLNNTGYTLRGGMDWATVGNLSGTVSVDGRRNLASYNVIGVESIRAKNIETVRGAQATARLGLSGPFSLEAGLSHRNLDYSAEAYRTLEYRQTGSSLGLYYRPSSAWRFGTAARYTQGKRPKYLLNSDGSYGADDYTRKDWDLLAQWKATGSSSLDARISRTWSTRSIQGGRSLSGLTGALSWNLNPGGRWSLNTRISRDSGLESYYLGIVGLNADYDTLTRGLQSQLRYELGNKLYASAGFNYSAIKRSASLITTESRDTNRGYSLGLVWQVLRNVELGCQFNQQSRGSTIAQYVYDAKSYGCYAQGLLR